MGASDLPYLYDRASNRTSVAYPSNDFNPKAVTEASYTRLSTQSIPKPKHEGPLINFNQHPDSYVVVSGAQTEHKALPPSTKKAIVSVRWVQFALRLVQESVALGLLVATICIKGTSGAETYLLRIPQAWDACITLYAIYHLARPAKSRTPGSSASYHGFALIMDTALIPLYIYITLLVNTNRQLPVAERNESGIELDGNWRWSSFFSTQSATNLLLMVTFLAAAVIAGLHLLSCGLDLYLIIIFRKISALPPDMNPLEANLTSRPRSIASKHKYKNSEITLASTAEMSEAERKKLAHLSGSTLGNGSRLSVAQNSMYDEKTAAAAAAPQLPFAHSRTGSQTSLAFSPHNPDSARWSRHQFAGQQDVYAQAVTDPRKSRYEVRADGKLDVRTRKGSQSPSKRSSAVLDAAYDPSETGRQHHADLQRQKRGSFVETFEMPAQFDDAPNRLDSPRPGSYMTARTSSPLNGASGAYAPTNAVVKSEQKEQLLNDNWYVLDEDEASDMGSPSRQRTPAPSSSQQMRNGGYVPVLHDRHDSFEPTGHHQRTQSDMSGTPKPLGMHPPTPPMPELEAEDGFHPSNEAGGVNRTLTAASNLTAGSSVYSESAPSLKTASAGTTPKGRYYGDLAAAQRGVLNNNGAFPRSGVPVPYGYGLPPPSPQPSRTPSPDKKARVISRSGADIADEAVLFVNESNGKFGMRSRREVSGKVAEEGRGGGSWGRRG